MNNTYILGLILLALTVIPIILLNINTYRKNSIIKKQLEETAINATITKQDYWNGYLIAIDEHEKKCFYIHKKDNSQCFARTIDLTKYISCHVIISKTLEEFGAAIELIELVFTPKDKDYDKSVLVFFNADIDGFTLNGELQTAERWKKICNTCMK